MAGALSRSHDGGGGVVDDGELAPAEPMANRRADGQQVGGGLDDDADRRAVERAADLEVGRVLLLARIHPPAG